MSKKNSKLYSFICPYSTRNLLVKAMARRILSARYVSPSDVPSFSSLINEIIEEKLNLRVEREILLPTKKTFLMFYMQKSIHIKFTEEVKTSGKSGPVLLAEIIISTDFENIETITLDGLEDEEKVGCSFNVLSECRTKLYKEIARKMLQDPYSIGSGASLNVAKMINEVLAARYNIAIKKIEHEVFVPNESCKISLLIENNIHAAFKNYCDQLSEDGNFVSMNATINSWILSNAAREMW